MNFMLLLMAISVFAYKITQFPTIPHKNPQKLLKYFSTGC